jgi:membrane AbrB-like protein
VTRPATPDTTEPPLNRPGPWPIALALALGAVGGALFAAIHVPLAWMLGPMIANMIAAVRGVPVLVPHQVRVVVLAIVGVFLGGSFSPELLDRVGAWLGSLALMLVFIPLVTFVAAFYFRVAAGFDRPTAVFSGAPGTLTAMVIVGGEAGADERMIALTQGLRVVLVVILMPALVTLIMGRMEAVALAETQAPFAWAEAAWLGSAAIAGYTVAVVFRLPAAAMTAALIVTTALYLTGTVRWHPPNVLFDGALWILGSAIGSRFSTVSARTFFRVSRHGVAATGLVILVSAAFAWVASVLTGTPYLTSLISFTPGGVAEMCLIAIAFDIDPAFVAVHHLTRIAILITVVPIAARVLFPGGAPPRES